MKSRFIESAFSLFKQQILDQKIINWSLQNKQLALSFYITSPRMYRLLRTAYTLPSVSTLKRFVSSKKIITGFNEEIFKALKIKCQGLSSSDRNCVLLIDEISLKKGHHYCQTTDRVVGVEEYNPDNRGNREANCATVLMIRGVRKKFKQQLAYFFHKIV